MTFELREIFLTFQMVFSLPSAAVVRAILDFGTLIFDDCARPDILETVNLVQFFTVNPDVKVPFVLLVISFVFSVLTFMPKAAEILSRRSTREASSVSFPARPLMSLAKRKLVIVLPPTADCSLVISVSVILFSTKKLRKDGKSKHPCLTPTEVLDQFIKVDCRVVTLL